MKTTPTLRRMLRAGQRVKVVKLAPGYDGQIGTVVRFTPHQEEVQQITDDGFWTVAFPDKHNDHPLHREVARRHLQAVRR